MVTNKKSKKVYVSPKLVFLGTVKDLTRGSAGSLGDAKGSKRPRASAPLSIDPLDPLGGAGGK